MKTVVVGGHTREIGKTAVMAGLIRDLRELDWTAVKLTQYGHGICSVDGEPCGCAPKEHLFALTEEKSAGGEADTCRYLSAGARRSLWMRVREGQLASGLPLLESELAGDDWVMIESNSILRFWMPRLYIFVLDAERSDFKASALEFMARADALVAIDSRTNAGAWPALAPAVFENKPVFSVAAGDFASPPLTHFVRERLSGEGNEVQWRAPAPASTIKERPCRH